MNIIVCDGPCKKQSPDKDGLFIANSWITVTAQTGEHRRSRWSAAEKVFCPDCWSDLRRPLGMTVNP